MARTSSPARTSASRKPASRKPASRKPASAPAPAPAPAEAEAEAPAPAPAEAEAPAPAPAPAPASGPYRSNAEWHAAHAAAVGALRTVPSARAALQVATHLAWRAPGGAVAWNKGTNPTMLGHAEALGIQVGMPVHEVMGLCLAALPEDHEQADALRAASAALLA